MVNGRYPSRKIDSDGEVYNVQVIKTKTCLPGRVSGGFEGFTSYKQIGQQSKSRLTARAKIQYLNTMTKEKRCKQLPGNRFFSGKG